MDKMSFEYNGDVFFYEVTDPNNSRHHIRHGIEKYGRILLFFKANGDSIGPRAIYGTEDEMSTISPAYARNEYIKMLQSEH